MPAFANLIARYDTFAMGKSISFNQNLPIKRLSDRMLEMRLTAGATWVINLHTAENDRNYDNIFIHDDEKFYR